MPDRHLSRRGADRAGCRLGLGLTRFGGHPESLARGAADAKNTSTIFAGVSPTGSGERGEPCGMPRRLSRASVVRVFRPRLSVSSTGQSSHILIRCSTRRSTTRRATDFSRSACEMLPKNTTTHYPSPRLSTSGDNSPRAAPLRGPHSASAGRRAPPRRSIAAGCAPRRQPLTDPGGVDRFGGNARRGTRRRD